MANQNPPPGLPDPQLDGHRAPFPWKTTLAALVLIAVISVIAIRQNQPKEPASKQAAGGRGGAIAAVIGTVEQKDFPLYLDGLGTVQAFNTVTVRSRVDGQLQKLVFQEGEDVRAGDLLAQIDPKPFQTQVAQAEGKKAQDEAQLENARIDLRRNATLLAGKVVSQEVYDTAKALVSQLEAAVKSDQAALDSASVQLAYASVTAPIDGRTGIRLVDVGNIIHAADSNGIVVLTQLRPISLLFTLPEQSLTQIRSHPTEALKVVAVDRDNTTVLDEGKLTVIDNQIDTTTGTIRLKATFQNENLKLWPGQFVNVRLLLSVRKGGIVVPASVVQRGPEGAYAFVVKDDMKVEMARLKVAQIDQGLALIDSGLVAGQRVVVDGQYKLQPGSTIKAAEPTGSGGSGTNTPPGSRKAGPGKGKKPPNNESSE